MREDNRKQLGSSELARHPTKISLVMAVRETRYSSLSTSEGKTKKKVVALNVKYEREDAEYSGSYNATNTGHCQPITGH